MGHSKRWPFVRESFGPPHRYLGFPLGLVAAVAVLTVAAWLILARVDHGAVLASIGQAFVTWNVMMVAMMLPSALPWFTLLVLPDARNSYELPALFGLGFFGVWAVYSAGAAFAQQALHHSLALDARLALIHPLGGAILIVAGLFQLTPLKRVCLRHCRSPIGYLLTHWRTGRAWALRAGISHGGHCVGCCWALMALAFVAGVMNLGGMVAITVVVCMEKLAPAGEQWSRWSGGALMAWGAALIALA